MYAWGLGAFLAVAAVGLVIEGIRSWCTSARQTGKASSRTLRASAGVDVRERVRRLRRARYGAVGSGSSQLAVAEGPEESQTADGTTKEADNEADNEQAAAPNSSTKVGINSCTDSDMLD